MLLSQYEFLYSSLVIKLQTHCKPIYLAATAIQLTPELYYIYRPTNPVLVQFPAILVFDRFDPLSLLLPG